MLKRILAALLALLLMPAAALAAGTDKAAIPANPQRVVDLTGNSDVLAVMGLNVVGTANARSDDPTRLPSYLTAALGSATVLGSSWQTRFDLAAIRALQPDLILITPQQQDLQEALKAIATTVVVDLPMRSWKMDMLSLGELFDRRSVVATWLDNYANKATYLGDNIRQVRGDTQRYLALMISGGQLYAFVDGGLGGVIFNDLGLLKPLGMSDRMGVNMTSVGYDQLRLLQMDYLFVVGSAAEIQELRHSEDWLKLPVVQANHVKELPTEPYLGMGYSCLGADALIDELATFFHAKNISLNDP